MSHRLKIWTKPPTIMALNERARNAISTQPIARDGKRKHSETIDLTGDSDTDDLDAAPRIKSQKLSQQNNVSLRRPSLHSTTSAYRSPPASSASRSSHHAPFSSYSSVYNTRPIHGEAERDSWLAEDDDDVFETIQGSQGVVANNEELTHFGDIPTKVVGIRFYNGYANRGEQILMRREPGNPYDSNAIRVDNVAGIQIGHIPRNMASKLAHFMDAEWLHLEGELSGDIGQFDCPLLVHSYGPDPQTDAGQMVVEEMKEAKLPLHALKEAEKQKKQREKEIKDAEKRRQQEQKKRLADARKAAAVGGSGSGSRFPQDPSQRGWTNLTQAGDSAQPVMADILEASQRINPRQVGQATDQYGVQEAMLEQMPSMKRPAAIKTDMLPYQLQALKWLLDQEDPQPPPCGSKEAVQLWKRSGQQDSLFMNIATSFSQKETPCFARGGILADDMGLGKTLEMISLIVADNDKAGRKTGTTLIVAPLSVMSNWRGQISHHLHKNHKLSMYTYHSAGRVNMNATDFAEYDVVITTYQTLASDYMPKGNSKSKAPERQLRKSGLYSMKWRRVILDEGHTVRNPTSKGAAAVNALMATSRWALTGTPIVNSLKDLYSLLRFVGVTGGLENLEMFNRVLVRPLKRGDPSATNLLRAIMKSFTLRRRKEMKFIDLRLPKLDEYVHRIEFTAKEKKRYDALLAEAQGLLKKYEKNQGQKGKANGQTFSNLLEILLRMRQCCNHWMLCGERITNLMAQLEEQKTVDLTPENFKALQDMLQIQIESHEDCPICLETLHDPVVTTCAHVFGRDCISKVIETQKKCPMCRAELKHESCLVSPVHDCGDEDADDEMDLTQSSSKLDAMMEILSARAKEGDKTVIFSQWTRFLDIVQARIDRQGYKYCRIDGTMKAHERDAALQSLDSDPECTIMLASLGVCAIGINLTAASSVIISDTWWAPAIEDQAVDRVHRLGQKKETRVFRMLMEDSVEEDTIAIQSEKRKLMNLAFAERNGKREKVQAGKLADIQRLLRDGKNRGSSGIE